MSFDSPIIRCLMLQSRHALCSLYGHSSPFRAIRLNIIQLFDATSPREYGSSVEIVQLTPMSRFKMIQLQTTIRLSPRNGRDW
jgi:hypothetical protein